MDNHGETIHNKIIISSEFNNYFNSVYNPKTDTSSIICNIPFSKSTSIIVSAEMVVFAIKKASFSPAIGPDLIPITFWKSLSNPISEILASLFTSMINENFVLNSWKTGELIPLFKGKGLKTSVTNYRPITITDSIS